MLYAAGPSLTPPSQPLESQCVPSRRTRRTPSRTVVSNIRQHLQQPVVLLREAGLTVFAFPVADSIDEVRERTLLTGELVGECEGVQETVDWMDEQLNIVEEAVADEEQPDVLYEFFGFTTGSGTHIHELTDRSGKS